MKYLQLFFCSILTIFFVPVKKVNAAGEKPPEGIDSEEGDAEMFYNKTYSEHQTSLERVLFRGYSTQKRPVRNESQPTVVDIHWHIVHISINQIDQTMTLNGHIYMKWFDEYLTWNPKDYNGIRTVRCKKWQVWQPKIKVANSASGTSSSFDFSTNAHVLIQMQEKNRAKVEMYPTFSIRVGCAFDFVDFPNDVNSCAISIFSSLPMTEIQLNSYYSIPPSLSFSWNDNVYKRKKKTIISDFDILNVTNSNFYYATGNVSQIAPVTENEMANTWSFLKTTVTFKRHSPFFYAAIGVPSVVTAIINCFSFLIPSITFAPYILMANLFIQIIFLQDMIKKIPYAVSEIPSCVRLYSFLMLMNTGCLLMHFFFVYLSNLKNSKVPKGLWFIYNSKNIVPTNCRKQDDDFDVEKNCEKWTTWINSLRPIIACILFIIYFIQIFVYIIL